MHRFWKVFDDTRQTLTRLAMCKAPVRLGATTLTTLVFTLQKQSDYRYSESKMTGSSPIAIIGAGPKACQLPLICRGGESGFAFSEPNAQLAEANANGNVPQIRGLCLKFIRSERPFHPQAFLRRKRPPIQGTRLSNSARNLYVLWARIPTGVRS
jgi:hypothetical protein